MDLKKPLQALLMAEELVDETADGSKYITIREGWRHYVPGKVVICCPEIAWCMMKMITEVIHTTPRDCEEQYYRGEEWVDREEMVYDLQRFYPDLTMDSPITVIKFEDLRI